MEPGKCAVY